MVAIPSARPIHEPLSLEDLGVTSDVALASFNPPEGSKFVGEPSSDISSANSEGSTHEDGTIKSDTMIANVKSLLASSFEEPHEDFEKECMTTEPDIEPIQELATHKRKVTWYLHLLSPKWHLSLWKSHLPYQMPI